MIAEGANVLSYNSPILVFLVFFLTIKIFIFLIENEIVLPRSPSSTLFFPIQSPRWRSGIATYCYILALRLQIIEDYFLIGFEES